jgi:predicted RNase H-like HicB family nuclease
MQTNRQTDRQETEYGEVSMLYTVVVHHTDDSAYGVTVPDIPGCFSAGDTLTEALANAVEAIEMNLELLSEQDAPVPDASDASAYVEDAAKSGGFIAVVDVDVTRFLGKAERINITLPARLLRRIDEQVRCNSKYQNRSHFLAVASQHELALGQS